MSTLHLTRRAEKDLRSLDREFFAQAVQAMRELATHPQKGHDVPLIQYYIDPLLKPPLKQFTKKTGTGFRLYLYYWPQGSEVWIEQIRLVPMM